MPVGLGERLGSSPAHAGKSEGRRGSAAALFVLYYYNLRNSTVKTRRNLSPFRVLSESFRVQVDRIALDLANGGFKPLRAGSRVGARHGEGAYFARDAAYSNR